MTSGAIAGVARDGPPLAKGREADRCCEGLSRCGGVGSLEPEFARSRLAATGGPPRVSTFTGGWAFLAPGLDIATDPPKSIRFDTAPFTVGAKPEVTVTACSACCWRSGL